MDFTVCKNSSLATKGRKGVVYSDFSGLFRVYLMMPQQLKL
jgi:hypothetical protein